MSAGGDRSLCALALDLPAAPERVFAALTERAALQRWFAEEARPLARRYGSYAFWGKHSLWTTHIKRSRQYLTRCEPPAALAFRWTLQGRPTEAAIALAPAGGGSRLALRHEVLEGRPETLFREMVTDFWVLALGNLLAYLESGEALLRLDYTERSPGVALSLAFGAPPERVFRALIEPAEMEAWIARKAEVEPRVGGRYSFGWTTEAGEPAGPTAIRALEPGRALAYGWHWPGEAYSGAAVAAADGGAAAGETLVRWELSPAPAGTAVSVRHEGFPAGRDSTDYRQGWAALLVQLKLWLERGLRLR